MAYKFQNLAQLVDKREGLTEKGEYIDYGAASKTVRVWHHSLTKMNLAGSDAASFADYHVNTLGWPGCGYAFVIEPKNIIKGPDGKDRARIVWAHDIGKKTYHVGNSNKFALGICVAGDYRTEKLTEPALRSISELHAALVADGIGKDDKAHREMPGYSWKDCCMFDYELAFKFKSAAAAKPTPLPNTYVIQEGDTFWSIAGKDGAQGVQVEDLIVANPKVDPSKLKVGQVINLGKAAGSYTKPATEEKKPQSSYKFPLPAGVVKEGSPDAQVKQVQNALNAVFFKVGEPDGKYGPKTRDAVKRFQSVYLPGDIDGTYGPKTKTKLQAVLKSKGFN